MTQQLKVRHVTKRPNGDGTDRYYFRRRGYPITRLPGTPATDSFWNAYRECLVRFERPDHDAARFLDGYRRQWAETLLRKAQERVRYQYKNVECGLTVDAVAGMMARQNDRCAMSGIKLRYNRPEDITGRDPFAPSIDRIDSSGHYTISNCRIVLLAVNVGLNEWGDAIYRKICRAVSSQPTSSNGD